MRTLMLAFLSGLILLSTAAAMPFSRGELLVRLNEGAMLDRAAYETLFTGFRPGLSVSAVSTLELGALRYQRVTLAGVDLLEDAAVREEAIARLNGHPAVAAAFENTALEIPAWTEKLPPKKPVRTHSWHLEATAAHHGWLASKGRGVIVAVIDTGVDYRHELLAPNIWTNEAEAKGKPGLDDDQNGYIDDYRGWDFTKNANDPLDSAGHGTHCAGIIAAEHRFAAYFSGMAPKAKVMPLKIIVGKTEGFLYDAAAAIKYAVDNGARVLSNSWRLYSNWTKYIPNKEALELLALAIGYANERNAVFIAAAGNESKDIDHLANNLQIYPVGFTALPNLIGVAAFDVAGKLSNFSNYGAKAVHVAAPGTDVYSTVPDNKYKYMSGTSMATPVVAGLAALMLSYDGTLTPAEVLELMVANSEPLPSLAGKVEADGKINAYKTLYETIAH
ncbi:MAG: hypothetical protein A2284_10155 [Deltaproteobacteria bacterium RIFOXYA12_FULL_61_11]|nr:MAG: hypothetical protein A2284_10155 [Deltaproteobacteria bacterium RIFOXYA12_FULL_61_11]